jgi:hypothetical protein
MRDYVRCVENNRLVARYLMPDGRIVSKGKRLPIGWDVLPRSVVRRYVEDGLSYAIEELRITQSLSILEAATIIRDAAIPPRFEKLADGSDNPFYFGSLKDIVLRRQSWRSRIA